MDIYIYMYIYMYIYIYVYIYIYNITLICSSPSSMSCLPDIWRDRLVNVGIFVKPILSTLGAFHVYHWLLISSALCMVILDIPRFLAAFSATIIYLYIIHPLNLNLEPPASERIHRTAFLQGGAPKIAKLIYNSNNYGL